MWSSLKKKNRIAIKSEGANVRKSSPTHYVEKFHQMLETIKGNSYAVRAKYKTNGFHRTESPFNCLRWKKK